MSSTRESSGTVAIYSLLAGGVYLLAGLVEVLNGVSVLDVAALPADTAEGLALLVIATLYVAGVTKQSQGEQESLPYTMVGSLLAAVLFGLYLSITVANGLGYLLQFENWLEWMWLDDLRPGIWLFPIALPGVCLALRKRGENSILRGLTADKETPHQFRD